ncbi:hypothetical protein ACFLSQ_06690 [Bacteroidota bacterium]
MKSLISCFLIIIIIIIGLFELISKESKTRNDYTGTIIYDKYILVDDSVHKTSGYLPHFLATSKLSFKYYTKNKLYFHLNNGFDNDLVEIFYNGKQIFNKIISTNNSSGSADGIKYLIDNLSTNQIISVRMNKGKLVDELHPKNWTLS